MLENLPTPKKSLKQLEKNKQLKNCNCFIAKKLKIPNNI